jgi:hypothetical protein
MEITDEWTQLDTNTWIQLASIRGCFLLFFGRGYAALLASIQGCSLRTPARACFSFTKFLVRGLGWLNDF